jgi:DNA-binding beta-propeller fold protein YncE
MTIARLMQMARAGVPAGDVWTDPDLANASYDGVSLDLSAEDTLPRNIFFKPDGLSLFMVGDNGADVNEYTLSSAWDITTASYTQNFSVSAQGGSPHGLFFKPDGTKFYTTDYGNDSVYEYSLSSAWDISTASYVQAFDVSTYETAPAGLFFKPDGATMYHVGFLGDEVNEYTLSTPWDISSASHIQAFSLSSQDTGPIALYFNPNGDKMWVSGNGTNAVYEYTLSTSWDISSASYSSVSFAVASQVGSGTSSLFFKSDGSKMYVSGTGTDTIYQYSTA